MKGEGKHQSPSHSMALMPTQPATPVEEGRQSIFSAETDLRDAETDARKQTKRNEPAAEVDEHTGWSWQAADHWAPITAIQPHRPQISTRLSVGLIVSAAALGLLVGLLGNLGLSPKTVAAAPIRPAGVLKKSTVVSQGAWTIRLTSEPRLFGRKGDKRITLVLSVTKHGRVFARTPQIVSLLRHDNLRPQRARFWHKRSAGRWLVAFKRPDGSGPLVVRVERGTEAPLDVVLTTGH